MLCLVQDLTLQLIGKVTLLNYKKPILTSMIRNIFIVPDFHRVVENAVKEQNIAGGVPSVYTQLSYLVYTDPSSRCSATTSDGRVTVGTDTLSIYTPSTITGTITITAPDPTITRAAAARTPRS
jgi:hypothetical protein